MSLQIEECSQPPKLEKRAKQLFAEAEEAGFKPLGWLSVTMAEPLLMAGFANQEGSITLAFIGQEIEKFDPLAIDLVSHLEGPQKLTTTTFGFVMPAFEHGLFKYSYPNASFGELLSKHREHLREIDAEPELFITTLPELADSIREYMDFEQQARQSALSESVAEAMQTRDASLRRDTPADPNDPFAFIREAGTGGGNYDLDTSDIIARLTKWQALCKFRVLGANHDTVLLEFDDMPQDMDAFVRDLYDFCPDLVDQGTGCVAEMVEMMEETGEELSAEMQELIEGVDFEDEDYGLEILKRELLRKPELQLWWD